MSNTIRIKRRVTGSSGAPSGLASAELAFNEVDSILYYGKGDNGLGQATTVISIGGDGKYVTEVTGTSPIVASAGKSPAISLADGYGDTKNPYSSKTANFVLAAPSSTNGAPTFRALVASDIPSLTVSSISNFSTSVTAFRLDQFAVPTSDVSFNSRKITNLSDPTSAQDAATKAYVDGKAQGLDVKESVRAATTANITRSGTQTIDGVVLVVGNRVLVKDQDTASQNGIYVVAAGAWNRSADADSSAEVTAGMFTFVEEGTINGDSGWVLSTNDSITLDTTGLTFTQFSGTGQIVAGDGLVKIGNTLNITSTGNGSLTLTADSINLTSGIVTPGTYISTTVDTYGRVTAGTNPTTLSGYGITDALSSASNSTQNAYFGDIFLYDDSSPSHYLQVTNSANLTAARSLSINVNDADRIISLSGNLTVSSTSVVSGTNTGDQTITLTGDVTGTGTGSFSTTLANSGVSAGTYNDAATSVRPFTVDAKGRITAIGTAVTIAPAFSSITGRPTTLSGYGITDAQPSDATLTALAGISTAADKLIYATGSDTFTTTDFTSFGRTLIDDIDSSAARITLGLGTMATQSSNNVSITGGSITNLTTFTGNTIDGGTF